MKPNLLGRVLSVLLVVFLLFGGLWGDHRGAEASMLNLPGDGMDCFRSLDGIKGRLIELVTNYGNLAEVVDIGDSWEKTDAGSGPGSDLVVLRLTNKAITGPKPVMFVVSGLDSRDILGVELSLRFAERLLADYGTDPDVTMVLDTSDVQLLIVANPDGREELERQLATDTDGVLTYNTAWARNRNTAGCTYGTPSVGVDLTRNFALGFTPNLQCNDDYPGPYAESEPETLAIATHLRGLFTEDRTSINAPVSENTSGLVINLTDWGYQQHFVYYPYHSSGFIDDSPTAGWIYSLAGKLANTPGEEDLLHQVKAEDQSRYGNLLDYAYGRLGVAALEMRMMDMSYHDPFTKCSQFTETVVDAWLDALLKAARSTARPFEFAQGPEIISLTASQSTASPSQTWDIEGLVDAWDYQNLFADKLPADPEGVDHSRSLPPWHESAVTSAGVYTPDLEFTHLGAFSTEIPFGSASTGETQLLYFQAYNTDEKFGLPRALFVTPTEMHYLPLVLTGN